MIQHYTAGGVEVVQSLIPAGYSVGKHVHDYSHLSILAKGRVTVECDGITQTYEAPATLEILAGKLHTVTAIVDSVWFCLHASNLLTPANMADIKLQSGG